MFYNILYENIHLPKKINTMSNERTYCDSIYRIKIYIYSPREKDVFDSFPRKYSMSIHILGNNIYAKNELNIVELRNRKISSIMTIHVANTDARKNRNF